MLRKRVHHLLRFVQAQQAVIDEDACELIADRAVHERGRDRRVDAARQAENDFLATYLLSNFLYRFRNVIRHAPVATAAAYLVHEAPQQLRALARMRDFRVELHAVEAALLIGHRGDRAGLGGGHQLEARRHLGDFVAVAHPDLEHAVTFGRAQVLDAVEQPGMAARADLGRAELTHPPRLHATAQLLRHGLHAVADAQHRNAEPEHRLRRLAGRLVVG